MAAGRKERFMNNEKHKINKEAMAIIRRGGACSKIEADYLSTHTPNEGFDLDSPYNYQFLLVIYLPEVRGYCNIYYPATPMEEFSRCCIGASNAIGIPTVVSGDKFYRQTLMHKLYGYAPFFMRFYDITYSYEFDTYQDLEEYSETYARNEYFLDARNDLEFDKLLKKGTLETDADFDVFMKYRNYVYYDDEAETYYAVVDLGNQERVLFPVVYRRDPNSIDRAEYIDHPDKGTIIYEKDEPPKWDLFDSDTLPF